MFSLGSVFMTVYFTTWINKKLIATDYQIGLQCNSIKSQQHIVSTAHLTGLAVIRVLGKTHKPKSNK